MSSDEAPITQIAELPLEMGSSFDSVNYGLRPNKTVERRLIFEKLIQLGSSLKLSEYRYLGFGAVLFVDFVLAHRALGIEDLVSIEYEANAARAHKNAPFGCIKVVPGDASVVLVNGVIDLAAKRTIAWMDYDGEVDATVIGDLEVLCTNLPVGSVVVVTANAVRKNYLVEIEEKTLDLSGSLQKTFAALAPSPLPSKTDSMNGFPPVVTEILMTHCRRVVQKSRTPDISFVPLFNFVYKDGNSPMVTVGGIIADLKIQETVGALPYTETSVKSDSQPFELELPILTPRERLSLDRLLPSSQCLKPEDVKAALGFTMRSSLTESYRRLYKFYPTFSETLGVS